MGSLISSKREPDLVKKKRQEGPKVIFKGMMGEDYTLKMSIDSPNKKNGERERVNNNFILQ